MREIIIITVSIVFVIIMYPIVFPDRSVILYVRDLSEKCRTEIQISDIV